MTIYEHTTPLISGTVILSENNTDSTQIHDTICRNCGAGIDKNQCEYCGSYSRGSIWISDRLNGAIHLTLEVFDKDKRIFIKTYDIVLSINDRLTIETIG